MKWMRQRVSWIAGITVGVFILWGGVSSVQSARTEYAGTLFGRKITLESFSLALKAVTHQAILSYGDQYRKYVQPAALQTQAWDRLMLLAEAKRRRIRVSNTEVVQEIASYPIFQSEAGDFDPKAYATIVQYALGSTPRSFEEETRDTLKLQKLIESVAGKPTVTEEELRTAYFEQETAIQIRFFTLEEEDQAEEAWKILEADPKQLGAVAKELKTKIIESEFFKQSDTVEALGLAGQFLAPLFGVSPGKVGKPVRTPQGWVVARVESVTLPSPEGLVAAKGDLRKRLIQRKRLKAYLAWYQALIKQADLKPALPVPPAPPSATPPPSPKDGD